METVAALREVAARSVSSFDLSGLAGCLGNGTTLSEALRNAQHFLTDTVLICILSSIVFATIGLRVMVHSGWFDAKTRFPSFIETGHKFCTECADLGRYGKEDSTLNNSFMSRTEPIRPLIALRQDRVKVVPPLVLQYSWDGTARRWECCKCGHMDKEEASIQSHCRSCKEPLPDCFFPQRGWWADFDMHRCTGVHIIEGNEDASDGSPSCDIRAVSPLKIRKKRKKR